MKVLVHKSYKFVERVWDCYMAKNMEDTRYTMFMHHTNTNTTVHDYRPLLDDGMEGDAEEDHDDNDDLENDGVYFDSDEVIDFILGFKCGYKVTIGNTFRIRIPFAYFLYKYSDCL